MKIGFIGIGVMGESMARVTWMEKGHSLTVYNRTKSKGGPPAGGGARSGRSAQARARRTRTP